MGRMSKVRPCLEVCHYHDMPQHWLSTDFASPLHVQLIAETAVLVNVVSLIDPVSYFLPSSHEYDVPMHRT